MGAIQLFSTRDVPPERGLDYWNQCARTTFPGMTVDAADTPFEADLARWQVGGLVLARPRSRGSRVRRAAALRPDEHLVIHLQRRGTAQQQQHGREALLRPGDLSVCTTAAPLQLVQQNHEMLVVQAPRAALDRRLAALDDRLGRTVAGVVPAVRLLHDFVLSLWREGAAGTGDPDWEGTVGEVLMDLLALALRAAMPDPAQGDFARLRRLVEARLDDPDLRGAALAAELGVSLRRVQQVFATVGTTPALYILERRLRRAAELLDGQPGRSVTALAFDLGFNDSAYFSRRFRRRFGVSPAAWRAGHRAPASS